MLQDLSLKVREDLLRADQAGTAQYSLESLLLFALRVIAVQSVTS